MRAFALLVIALFVSGLLALGDSFGAQASDLTQTVSGGGVTAKATYLNPKSNSGPRFQVGFDTHSVGLDSYDLKSITVLRDDAGKQYSPTSAENKGGGHHRQVTLTFPTVAADAKHLELVIKGVAGVQERTFRWTLE